MAHQDETTFFDDSSPDEGKGKMAGGAIRRRGWYLGALLVKKTRVIYYMSIIFGDFESLIFLRTSQIKKKSQIKIFF